MAILLLEVPIIASLKYEPQMNVSPAFGFTIERYLGRRVRT
jgi:hypothetical protein